MFLGVWFRKQGWLIRVLGLWVLFFCLVCVVAVVLVFVVVLLDSWCLAWVFALVFLSSMQSGGLIRNCVLVLLVWKCFIKIA